MFFGKCQEFPGLIYLSGFSVPSSLSPAGSHYARVDILRSVSHFSQTLHFPSSSPSLLRNLHNISKFLLKLTYSFFRNFKSVERLQYIFFNFIVIIHFNSRVSFGFFFIISISLLIFFFLCDIVIICFFNYILN